MKEKLAINFGKYLFGPKAPFHWKRCFSWCLGAFLGFLRKNIVQCQTFFLCLLYIYTIASFHFFCEFIELSSKLGLQRDQFRSWLPEQQNPQNLRAWFQGSWKKKLYLKIVMRVTCIGFSNIEESYQCCNFGCFWWLF